MPVLVSCVFVQEARIGPVLRIVHRVIAGWLADQTGVERTTAQCCAVTLIQRFGSALNLNVHFHMLWLDGVCEPGAARPARSRIACAGIWRAKADSKAKTNRHFCPTAQAAKTAWTRCECARAPELERLCRYIAPHLTRFHGVFAPNAALRAQLTPSGRGKRPATDDESTRANSGHRSLDEKRRPVTFSAAPQARVWHRREHLRPLCWNGTDRGQHRRTGLPRVHRPLMPRDTPPATTPKAKPRRQREAATNPQGRARPAVGNQREWPPTTDGNAA